MKNILIIMISFSLLFACSCSPEAGPTGPEGEDGTAYAQMVFQQGLYPNPGYSGCEDTRIFSGPSTENYGSCFNLGAGYTSYIARSLLKFDIEGMLPAGSTIKKAYISVYVRYYQADTTWSLYKVTQSWSEGTAGCGGTVDVDASWDYYNGSGNSWSNAGGDFDSSAISNSILVDGDLEAFIDFDINASVVQSWLDNPSANYGVILKADNEDTDNYASVYSSEETDIEYRPKLTVYYTTP